MDELFVRDEVDEDDYDQRQVRQSMSKIDIRDQGEPPFQKEEIQAVIKRMKPGKAPGWDSIEVIAVQKAYPLLKEKLKELYDMCLNTDTIPNEWKRAIVVTLLKSAEKDPREPASYRPICLLPVMGKILEGLILTRIQGKVEAAL